jgi:hypothetical protein
MNRRRLLSWLGALPFVGVGAKAVAAEVQQGGIPMMVDAHAFALDRMKPIGATGVTVGHSHSIQDPGCHHGSMDYKDPSEVFIQLVDNIAKGGK